MDLQDDGVLGFLRKAFTLGNGMESHSQSLEEGRIGPLAAGSRLLRHDDCVRVVLSWLMGNDPWIVEKKVCVGERCWG